MAPHAPPLNGLTAEEVEERTRDGRVNLVPDAPTRTVGQIVRANVFTPVNGIISVMFVLIMIAAPGPDALFAGVVISNSVIGIVQELRAKRELDRLAGIHDEASFAELLDNPANAVAALARADEVRSAAMAGPFLAQEGDGTPVRDQELLARIRSLAVPPAWTEVWICPDPEGHIQATGRDQRGRKQYRYLA